MSIKNRKHEKRNANVLNISKEDTSLDFSRVTNDCISIQRSTILLFRYYKQEFATFASNLTALSREYFSPFVKIFTRVDNKGKKETKVNLDEKTYYTQISNYD